MKLSWELTAKLATRINRRSGGILEKVVSGGVTDWRHSVSVGGQIVAIISRKSSGTDDVNYLLGDHQGSPSALTDDVGASVVQESFGAFGLPRDGASWSGAVSSGDQAAIAGISRRGYTGHSMLGQMQMIHMNGRVYDAFTGRFLSPDPYVQDPGFTQSYNRYAYVVNNPLSYVDPSGFVRYCTTVDIRNSWASRIPDYDLFDPKNGGVLLTGRDNSFQVCNETDLPGLGPNTVPDPNDIPGNAPPLHRPTTPPGDAPVEDPADDKSADPKTNPGRAPPQSQSTGKCWNGGVGVGGALQGPVLGPFGGGVSGNILGGISYGGSWLDSRITVQGQISGFYGTGLYGGFGVTAQGGPGEVAQGFSGSLTPHAEANLGIGLVSASLSADFTSKGYQSIGGWAEHARISRLGVGVGVAAGVGSSATGTYATPSIRQAGNALGSLFGFRNLFGSAVGCP